MKKILKVISDILIVLIFSVLLLSFGSASVSKYRTGVPSVFGFSVVQVLSPSMTNSGINVGDYYLIENKDNYYVGDVIAFHRNNEIWFHEIINLTEDGYVTKGSSNINPDSGVVLKKEIVGVKISNSIEVLKNTSFIISCIMLIYVFSMGSLILQYHSYNAECYN